MTYAPYRSVDELVDHASSLHGRLEITEPEVPMDDLTAALKALVDYAEYRRSLD